MKGDMVGLSYDYQYSARGVLRSQAVGATFRKTPPEGQLVEDDNILLPISTFLFILQWIWLIEGFPAPQRVNHPHLHTLLSTLKKREVCGGRKIK